MLDLRQGGWWVLALSGLSLRYQACDCADWGVVTEDCRGTLWLAAMENYPRENEGVMNAQCYVRDAEGKFWKGVGLVMEARRDKRGTTCGKRYCCSF